MILSVIQQYVAILGNNNQPRNLDHKYHTPPHQIAFKVYFNTIGMLLLLQNIRTQSLSPIFRKVRKNLQFLHSQGQTDGTKAQCITEIKKRFNTREEGNTAWIKCCSHQVSQENLLSHLEVLGFH